MARSNMPLCNERQDSASLQSVLEGICCFYEAFLTAVTTQEKPSRLDISSLKMISLQHTSATGRVTFPGGWY